MKHNFYLPVSNNPDYTDLKCEVYYDLGGINYWNGGYNKRGINVSVTAIKTETHTLENGDKYQTETLRIGNGLALKYTLEELTRKSQKKIDLWFDRVQADAKNHQGIVWELVEKVCERGSLCLA